MNDMKKAHAMRKRIPSIGGEIANSIRHGVGLPAAAASAPVLVHSAVRHNGAARIAGASVFH